MEHEDLGDGWVGRLPWHVLEHPHNLLGSEGRVGEERGGGGMRRGGGGGGRGGAALVGTRSRIGQKDRLHVFLEQGGKCGVQRLLNCADLLVYPILRSRGKQDEQ